MYRRKFLSSCCLAVGWVAGCAENEEESQGPAQNDIDSRFLEEDETPESDGAEEFLGIVEEETDGLYRFKGDRDIERIGFSEGGDTWQIRYYGHATGEEEVAELATAFASHRPDGVSLKAETYHECTTGYWQVSADIAAKYERGELDRETFVDRVRETVETVNNC